MLVRHAKKTSTAIKPKEGFQMSYMLVLAFIAVLAFGTQPQPMALARRFKRQNMA